jgi:septum formation protein
MPNSSPKLILASNSAYRKALLERLNLPFDVISSNADESADAGENNRELAARLAYTKAQDVWKDHPEAIVIGSDQVANLDGERLRKPGTDERAVAQLQRCSGKTLDFYTAVTILGPGGARLDHLDVTQVSFRNLELAEIQRYVEVEQPLDCAGAFKAEALGISLFTSISSQDPTALTGLPLIWVSNSLRRLGLPNP